MSRSRKGKQASKNLVIKQFERTLNDKFEKCPFDKRKELFKTLENWAYTELNEDCCELFITALYNAQATKDIQFEISVEKALEKISK